jgi:hypothetical protein
VLILLNLALERLSIHFSAHIELNQRILNSDAAQRLVDALLAELGRLKRLHIFTFPPVRLRLTGAPYLEEFGLFSSDLTQIVHAELPSLKRLHIQADFKTLVVRQGGRGRGGNSGDETDVLNSSLCAYRAIFFFFFYLKV